MTTEPKRYYLIQRLTERARLFFREGSGIFTNEEGAATRYETMELAGTTLDRLMLDPASVVERIEHLCCASPDVEDFTCDGLGGGYKVEWCAACGSLRREEFVSATSTVRRFTPWQGPRSSRAAVAFLKGENS